MKDEKTEKTDTSGPDTEDAAEVENAKKDESLRKSEIGDENGNEIVEPAVLTYTDVEYYLAALFLSRRYSAIKAEREDIRRWEDDEEMYTEEDALEELVSISAVSDTELGVRVQKSSISDQTARIGSLLASGYAQKKNERLLRKMSDDMFGSTMKDYSDYLDWKTGIVDTAMKERMTKLQKNIYQLLFFKHLTYSQLIAGNRGKHPLNNWKIGHEKNTAVEKVAQELMLESDADPGRKYISRLMQEATQEENGH